MKNALSWENELKDEKKSAYFLGALEFVNHERANGKIIYPAQENVFNALKYTPLNQVKAVILGQDPYHGPNQAHGLSFSVLPGVPKPPSLRNIFKELHDDLQCPIPQHGNLEKWAKEGVLLLNTILTVEASKPLSHANIGWQQFTNKVIEVVSEKTVGTVFLLWGAPAQSKITLIDTKKHHILTATHPSPLSAHRGFLGCRHFSKTNGLLHAMKKPEIDWCLIP